MTAYYVARLLNGLYQVTHRGSGLRGLFNADGTPRSGDLYFDQGARKAVAAHI